MDSTKNIAKNKMIGRTWLIGLLATAICLAVSGCGSSAADGAKTATYPKTETETQARAAAAGVVEGESAWEHDAAPGAASETAAAADEQQNAALLSAQVTKVIDGDTIKVLLNGREETIRLLLIDTPETHHPRHGEQPFGPEAKAFVTEILEDKTVQLEQDVTNGPDKYGRLLYYVYVDGKSVQEMLLEKGLARVAYVYVPNVKHVDKYRELQRQAQEAAVGIWSIENYVQEDGYHPEAVKAGETAQPSGRIEVRTSGKQQAERNASAAANSPSQQSADAARPPLRYDPFGPDRDCADFSSQAEAQAFYEAAGGPEKDPHRLDRDRDGLACEQYSY